MVKFFREKHLMHYLKKLIAIVLVLSCSFGVMTYKTDDINPNYAIVASAYSSGNYRVNTSSGVNVRTGAGTGYSKAGSATNGTTFSVDQISGSWGHTNSIKCTSGYKSGWVCLQYCSYISSNSGSSSTSSGTSSSGSKHGTGVVYNCSALNVRTGPGTNFSKKTSIKCGTSVWISFTSGNWGFDTLHGGYVSLSYISFSGGGDSNSYISLGSNRAYVFEPLCARGKVVDVSGWGTTNGTNIHIWAYGSNHQANQFFKPVDMGNGYYCFMDTNSGKYIDVSGGIVSNGTNVQLYEYNGTAAQQWRVIHGGKSSDGKNYYYIQSKLNSDYYLDISGGNSGNGTNVQFWVGNSTNAQKYILYYTSYDGNNSSPDNNNSSLITTNSKPASKVITYSKSKDGNTYLSAHFKVSEFACRDGNDTILIDQQLVYYLELIREHFGKPVTINSAYRTQSYNAKVRGADKSQHMYGRAADIVVSGVSPSAVYAYADSIGMPGLGKYSSFTHIDTRSSKSRWTG